MGAGGAVVSFDLQYGEFVWTAYGLVTALLVIFMVLAKGKK